MTDHPPRMLTIRVLSFFAFVACITVIPLAKVGKTGTAVVVAALALALTTGFVLAWDPKPPLTRRMPVRSLLRAAWVLFSGFALLVISAAVFGTPGRVATFYRYVVEKLFFLGNKLQLLLGLPDLMPRHLWKLVVGALFCLLFLTFLLWILRLRVNTPRLLVFCALALFGMILGLLAPSAEFNISSSVISAQMAFHVASAPAGNFVAAWQTKEKDADDWDLYASLYGADGIPRGSEFQLNTYTDENQFVPRAAMDDLGNFAIAWESKGQDGSGYGVYCRRYDSAGIPQGEAFQVNTTTHETQNDPSIAMSGNGDFVIVWNSNDGNESGIFGQRFDAIGNRIGGEFQVNTFTHGNQKKAFVSSDKNGNLAVVWESDGQDGSGKGVYARRYDATGSAQGNEFQVNTYSSDDQFDTWVNIAPHGEFVVVWSSRGQDGSGLGVYGRRYNASGEPLGDEFLINTFVASDQQQPSASSDANGNLVVVWESDGADGSGKGVFGQRYDATGNKLGNEFQVNIYPTNDQFGPSVAFNVHGGFVVIWTSFGQDGYTEGVYGRIYTGNGFLSDLIN